MQHVSNIQEPVKEHEASCFNSHMLGNALMSLHPETEQALGGCGQQSTDSVSSAGTPSLRFAAVMPKLSVTPGQRSAVLGPT